MKQPIFKQVGMSRIKWWEWFLLKFKPKKISYDSNINEWVVEWKRLFGKFYILKYYQVPPQHPNCRCYMEVNGEQDKD